MKRERYFSRSGDRPLTCDRAVGCANELRKELVDAGSTQGSTVATRGTASCTSNRGGCANVDTLEGLHAAETVVAWVVDRL